MKRIFSLVIIGLTIMLFPLVAGAARPFYQGKTFRIIVGYTPGGGGGTYATVLSRYMGKHIPGNPSVIVQYMPGAQGLVAANRLYNRIRPDGLAIGLILMGHMYPPYVAEIEGVHFDIRKWQYIGNAASSNNMFVMRSDSAYKSLEAIKRAKRPPRLGFHGKGSNQHLTALAIEEGLGVKFKYIFGYKGGSVIDLAMERGELDGRVSSLYTYLAQKPDWIKEGGFVKVFVQSGVVGEDGKIKRDPLLLNVPTIAELFPSPKVKQLRKFAQIGAVLGKPFMAPPKTPKDRVEILRKAFLETLNDRTFLAEAKRLGVAITPMKGEMIITMVNDALELDPELLKFFKKLMRGQ